MKWVACTYEYLMAVERQEIQCSQDVREYIDDSGETRAGLRDNAAALLDGDAPIACVGIAPMWKGVGMAWAVLSERSLENPVFLTRSVLMLLEGAEEAGGYKRIQADVHKNHDAGHRWIRALGFAFEGIMHNYGVGGEGTYYRYARTR